MLKHKICNKYDDMYKKKAADCGGSQTKHEFCSLMLKKKSIAILVCERWKVGGVLFYM